MRTSVAIFMQSIIAFAMLSFAVCPGDADTIRLKDGRELKGIVVEDYQDRLVFSMPDGEIQLLKGDIGEMLYDSDEDNLVKLGDQAKERSDYQTAFAYYDKAYKINPQSKAAKDGIVYVQSFLFRREETKKELDVNRRAEFEQYQATRYEAEPPAPPREDKMKLLRSSLGMTLENKENQIIVNEVVPRSPASEAEIKKGDCLVALWGKLTGYMDMKQVVETLLLRTSAEVKTTIERETEVDREPQGGLFNKGTSEAIGVDLSMEIDGLTVKRVYEGGRAHRAGIKKGDLIIAIDGKPTRYMPLKKAIKMIVHGQNDIVTLRVRRETTIWRSA